MTWIAKRDRVVVLPDGARRWVFADQPIPPELVDLVPAKDRAEVPRRHIGGVA